MLSKRVKENNGYLLIDNRMGPTALPQRQVDGSERLVVPAETLFEADTLTCAHCQATVILNPARKRERGFCAKCNAYVCDKFGCRQECNPIAQMVDLQLRYPDAPIIDRDARGLPIFDLDRLKFNTKIR